MDDMVDVDDYFDPVEDDSNRSGGSSSEEENEAKAGVFYRPE